jgi:hypothetical protein
LRGGEADPYRVMGLPVGATKREIKRRYRQLLRRHHPDVADDPARAHEFAAEIGHAYTLLMDDEWRARYEAELFGGPESDLQVVVERADPARSPIPDLLRRARELLSQGRLEDTLFVCSDIIMRDPDCAEAYAILGRAYQELGRADLSREMYEEARRRGPMGSAPFRQAASAAAGKPPETRPPRPMWVPAPVAVNHPVEAGGLLVAAALIVAAHFLPGAPGGLPGAAPVPLLLALAAGFVMGLSLAASGRIGTWDQELAFFIAGGGVRTPVWLLVVAGSVVAAGFGAAAHLVALLGGERKIGAWVWFWSGVAAVAVGFAFSVSVTAGFWWLGLNLVALAGLAGWLVGGVFSPREWWR